MLFKINKIKLMLCLVVCAFSQQSFGIILEYDELNSKLWLAYEKKGSSYMFPPCELSATKNLDGLGRVRILLYEGNMRGNTILSSLDIFLDREPRASYRSDTEEKLMLTPKDLKGIDVIKLSVKDRKIGYELVGLKIPEAPPAPSNLPGSSEVSAPAGAGSIDVSRSPDSSSTVADKGDSKAAAPCH